MSSGSKYFAPSKKGEVHELRTELESGKEDRQVNAIKKIIAGMTVGKDVSVLFPQVVKCMVTDNLELKKLVYLYIMNYAKSKPDLAILAVNAFVKDTQHTSPLIRALAVRTMGCIRVQRITEYLCPSLHACLKDKDPYVRKTSAVCVAKLWDISPELVETQGFLDTLLSLLTDSNPMVVANVVAALSEIQETSTKTILVVNPPLLNKLLAALNECTEWGQVFILNFLATYKPADAREAENVADRITPRLQHANSAVVLAAVKCIMKYMDHIRSNEIIRNLKKKMAPPLVTLLSKEPEIQYVALRNINLIVQKRSNILANDQMKVFFCKFNDPIYVKMEKLELMIMLANDKNIDQMLMELKEYATEADVEFVRKSVRAIGRCAIKLESAAERCIQVLLGLVESQINYVVHESIIVIKDIFRKYPGKYESIIGTLCENLVDDAIDEPEARAAMIWIIGEYSDRIDNSDELLENFLDNFHDEPVEVQLQLLTASVKLFLHKPKKTKRIVHDALNMATRESDNPDLRDRGFIYWRLLSANPEAAKKVVLSQKPLISDASLRLEPALLDDLVSHISTLASVYHKPPETFVSKLRRFQKSKQQAEQQAASSSSSSQGPPQMQMEPMPCEIEEEPQVVTQSIMDDLINLEIAPANAQVPPSMMMGGGGMGGGDLLGGFGAGGMSSGGMPSGGFGMPEPQQPQQPPQPVVNKVVLVSAEAGGGMEVQGAIVRKNGQCVLDMTVVNRGQQPFSRLELRFNKNSFQLTSDPGPVDLGVPQLDGGAMATADVVLTSAGPALPLGSPLSNKIQLAIRNSTGKVGYGAVVCPLSAIFSEDGKLDSRTYLDMWKQDIANDNEVNETLYGVRAGPDELRAIFESVRIFFVAKTKSKSNNDVLYFSMKTNLEINILLEIAFGEGSANACVKCANPAYGPLLIEEIKGMLV
mmetsp:Transcript_10625/g.15996  ORF Transcript_10625/g.15996 Transcript_10625/m.15996 type:complete len:934 (-) Transcript_10625:43-2844(-)